MSHSSDLLKEIIQRIVAVSDPEQIVLFGSYARGDFGPDSDLDLLVIKDEVESTRAEAARIYRVLADIQVPIDVVVVRTPYVQRYGDLVGTVVRPALREGKVLYPSGDEPVTRQEAREAVELATRVLGWAEMHLAQESGC